MKTYKWFLVVASLVAWIGLFVHDWVIGLCIFFIIWNEDLAKK